ncbi:MAG: pilin [Patescibacteria group bacterium]|nr:pilin [Patescibacteria group bacterium]
MKNISKQIIIVSLFVFSLIFFLCSDAKAAGEPCAQVNGTTVAQCYKGESAGWSGLWATKCPGSMNACAYYNQLQCGNCPTQGDVCCTTDELVNSAPSSAPNTGASSSTPISSSADNTSSGLVPCNTNCTLCHLVVGFKRIFDFFIGLLFVATMLAITVAGVFYMVSAGSKALTETAKKSLTYALTAFVIGMGAWIIINTIMVGLGFRHPYGGNWWEFTCDTSPSKGPTGSGSSPNWAGGKDNQNQSGECTPTGNGCGGMTVQGGGCEYTSAKLSQVLSCMNQKGLNAPVTSVTLNQNSDWCQKCVWNYAGKDYCAHVQNSCHFGGANCKGTAQAADIGGKGAQLDTIAAVARECGAEYVLYNAPGHYDHAHISINNAECGCK